MGKTAKEERVAKKLDEIAPLEDRVDHPDFTDDGEVYPDWWAIPKDRWLANDLMIYLKEVEKPGSSGVSEEELLDVLSRLVAANAIELDYDALQQLSDELDNEEDEDGAEKEADDRGQEATARAAHGVLDVVTAAADVARLAAARPLVVEAQQPAVTRSEGANPARVAVLRRALETHGERLRAVLASGEVPPGYTAEDVAEALS